MLGGPLLGASNRVKKIVHTLDSISEWTGKISAWLIAVLILVLVFEVVSRYVFNSPTFWAYDISYMVGGAAVALGGAYALKNRQHVRVDVIYERFPPRVQAFMDIFLILVLFFPLLILGFMTSYDAAVLSWAREERIMSGFWAPIIYPLKTVIPISFGLLILQGISDMIRDIYKLLGREF
jgi:TRAP-type mannitol/chloroaromatic compound transport system permease small subunit